jgi:hypothetical protein
MRAISGDLRLAEYHAVQSAVRADHCDQCQREPAATAVRPETAVLRKRGRRTVVRLPSCITCHQERWGSYDPYHLAAIQLLGRCCDDEAGFAMPAKAALDRAHCVMQQGIGIRILEALEKRSSFHCQTFPLRGRRGYRARQRIAKQSVQKAVVRMHFKIHARALDREGSIGSNNKAVRSNACAEA